MLSTDFWALPPAEREKLLQGPALAPPPGVVPNFDDPPNGNAVVISVCGSCLVVGSFFVFVRVSGMERSWKKIFISDYLMLVSYVLFVAYVAVLLREVNVGFLVHQWDFRLRDLPEIFYLFALATNFFTTTILLLKTAILLEWQRLFVPSPGRRRRNCFFWASALLLAVNVGFNAAAVLVVNLACVPHEKNWNMLVPGRCFDGRALFVASAVVNFAIDLAILVLPQKVIWGLLQLSFRKRLGVSVVFVVGVIACIAAAFRIPVSVRYTRSQDVTYDFCIVGIWAMVESTCGLIVYCTPAFPKALAKLRGGNNNNNNNNKTTPPSGTKDTAITAATATITHPTKPQTGHKMSGVWKMSSLRRGGDNNSNKNNLTTRNDTKPEAHRYLELRDYRHPSPRRSDDLEAMPNPAILRTTRVDVRTEEAGYHGAPGIGGTRRQLPWA